VTTKERIARAQRAETFWGEFLEPMLTNMRSEYMGRISDVAATELAVAARTDKLTTLSQALRILDNIEGGMREAIRDGEIARQEKLRAEKIEQMSDAQQRLLRIGVV